MVTLHVSGRAYRILPWGESHRRGLGPGEARLTFGSLDMAQQFLRRAVVADPRHRALLRRVAAAAFPQYRLDLRNDETIWQLLARSLVTGRVQVVALPPPVLHALQAGEQEAPASVSPLPARLEERPEKTWIEIELLGEGDQPIAGERYRIKLTDGSIHTGRLNDLGRARFDWIDPGVCVVWFPDLSGTAWGTVPAGADEDARLSPGPPGKTWVEIELVGEDDEPIAGERYELRLPGGRVETGRLDEFGSAFYDDVDPGTCDVSFPDLSPGCWEAV